MRLLLLGTPFYGYADALKAAFEELGCEVELCILKDYWSETIIGRTHVKFWNLYKALIKKPDESYKQPLFVRRKVSQSAIEAYRRYKPDLIVNFAAYMLTDDALKQMQPCPKVLWIFDSITNLSKIYPTLPYYDELFSFEETDVHAFQERGFSCSFLPLCADKSVYKKTITNDNKRTIDLCFIGHMTKQRVQFFRNLHRQMPSIIMRIYGVYVGKFNILGKLLRKINHDEEFLMNRFLKPIEINELYNTSKICVNVHHRQTKAGGNMRLYEILASGAFEITDSNPYIDREFSTFVGIYHDENELVELIKYYLTNDAKRIEMAAGGQRKVLKDDLFLNRAKAMLERIGKKDIPINYGA